MLKYIALQTIRSNIKLFKTFFWFYFGLAASIIFFFPSIRDIISQIPFKNNFTLVCVGLILIGMYYVFIHKNIPLQIHPATFHFTFNSEVFQKIKLLCALAVLIKSILITLLLTSIMSISGFPNVDILFFANNLIYFSSCIIIKWIKYKSFTFYTIIAVLIEFLLISSMYLLIMLTANPIFIFHQFAILAIIIFHSSSIVMDWDRYFKDMNFHALLSYAGRNMDMALMKQLTDEYYSDRRRIVGLNNLLMRYRNTLLCKALICF